MNFFRSQLDLAAELQLPVVIHQRDKDGGNDCQSDLLEIISDYENRVQAVFHCFTSSLEQAQPFLDQGHLISFTGIATFPSAKDLQETAREVPEDRFMLETDSPYLAPVPYRENAVSPHIQGIQPNISPRYGGFPWNRSLPTARITQSDFSLSRVKIAFDCKISKKTYIFQKKFDKFALIINPCCFTMFSIRDSPVREKKFGASLFGRVLSRRNVDTLTDNNALFIVNRMREREELRKKRRTLKHP